MFDAMEVISAGLSVARAQTNILAANIANANTTVTPEGGPYKRRDLVVMARSEQSSFSNVLDRMSLSQPSVHSVVEDQSPPRKVYEPGHPSADKEGFVSYPNINIVSTMTDLMSATRLYQANVTALETARQIGQNAYSIIRSA